MQRGFQFKQFFIEHDNCAMKVGTDSIMLGSWITANRVHRALDIGCGSGLLAIMLAQKTAEDCQIIGIDIDAAAVQQANTNAKRCPWPHKLQFLQRAAQTLQEAAVFDSRFDLIVSNPPFYASNPKANTQNQANPDLARIQARQTTQLSHASLLHVVTDILATNGVFYCVLPELACENFIQLATTQGLHCCQQLLISAKPAAKVQRRLMKFCHRSPRAYQICTSESLAIYAHTEAATTPVYSGGFKQLCRDYYLHF
ncbi:MAG: methyltransferase domain-containing protein [Paraglaciecola sp.]|nr:methyltransferase domain-containing protein [Paraglaciecola sp.]